MGLKSKKGKPSPLHKNPTKNPRSWPDLPSQLLTQLAKNSTLMQNISYGGNVTKSYRLPPKQCNPTGKSPFPQLFVNDNGQTDQCRDKSQYHSDIFNITFRFGEFWPFLRRRWTPHRDIYGYIVGYSQGMVVCRNAVEPSKYGVWDPINRPWWDPPLWDVSVPFKHVALSSSPKDYNSICTVMVLTGMHCLATADRLVHIF